MVCPQYYELRDSKGKTFAKGDGETFEVAVNKGNRIEFKTFTFDYLTEKYGSIKSFMESAAQTVSTSKYTGEWRETLKLRFMMPGVPITGLWEISTKGKDSSIPSLVAEIDRIYAMTGRLKYIPFDLMVEIHKSDKSGDSRKYPVLKLICNYSPEDMEAVQSLPGGFHGVLTSEKVQELKSGSSQLLLNSSDNNEIEDADFEEE